jgi:Tol biopolymer transport system component
VRIDAGQLGGAVYDPKVHPDGNTAIFEYNQRIWQLNLDGSGLEEVAYGSARLSSPAYSPDGTAIAFLASEDEPGALLYVKHIAGDEYYALDIRSQLSSDSPDGIPGGPITWTP